MRRQMGLGVLVAWLLAAVLAGAQTVAQSYESVTVANTAIGLSAATIRPSTTEPAVALCSGRLETAQIRFRFDGTDPTSAEGILLEVGEVIELRGSTNIQRFKAIRTGSTSGVLKMHCGKD